MSKTLTTRRTPIVPDGMEVLDAAEVYVDNEGE